MKNQEEPIETTVEEGKGTELVIKTIAPLVTANFEIIKMDLERTLQSYNLILSRDTIKDGKTAAAHLNKMKAAIKAKEKTALEMIMSPVDGFREKVSELIALVDDTRDKITAQVKAYEDKTRDEIREQLKDYRESRLNYAGLREPYRTIEIEDLVLLGNQTKTGNLTGKVMEVINGRVSENKAAQLQADAAAAERAAAEEARIAAEVEKRAEQNRIEEERKAQAAATAEVERRAEEIRAKEREKVQEENRIAQEQIAQQAANKAAMDSHAAQIAADTEEEYRAQIAAEAVCAIAGRPTIPEDEYIYPSPEEVYRDHPGTPIPDTPQTRAAAQQQINEEIEVHQEYYTETRVPAQPEYNQRTGEITPLEAVSVYFELKIETGGASAMEVAKFVREWIAGKDAELGAEIQRIGVTQADGSISWNN